MRVQVSRHESPSVCWEMWSRDAAPAQRPHAIGCVGYREWGSKGFRRLETPSREVHVILSFGPRIRTGGEEVASFVAAPHTRHAVVESRDRVPGARVRVRGHALHEAADGTVQHAELRFGDGLVMLGGAADGEYARIAPPPGSGSVYVAVDRRRRAARAGGRRRRRGRVRPEGPGLRLARLHRPRPRGQPLVVRHLPPGVTRPAQRRSSSRIRVLTS